ncbi:MAG TPA: glycosyltransferase family 39 protein [Vicinamibacteria bacterium]|nr:glycosyltransferase family 39 protein [Vicinamibacteria bacterium]
MSDAPPAEARPVAPLWTILAVTAVVAAVFYAFHVEGEWWLDLNPKALGALRTRHFVPLIARSGFAIGLWSLPALGVLGLFLLSARALFLRTSVRPAVLLLASIAFFFAIGTSVGMIDGYIATYDRSLQPAVLYPYTQPFASYADVPRVETKGPANFLRNFPRRQLNDVMANHSRTHPPGPVLFLWVVSRLFGPGLVPAWLATVLFASLTTIPVFFLARDLYGETAARRALALFLLVPSVILFTTTSMDGPMMVFLVAAIWAFLRATAERARWWWSAIVSGLALALASFMTYTASYLLLFFGVIAVLAFFTDRPRFWRIARLVPVAALTCLAFYGALYLAVGYDPIAALQRAVWANNELVGTGHGTFVQYLHVSLSNLFAFLFGMGFALVAVWLLEVKVAAERVRAGEQADLFVLAFPISLLVITFSALYTLEVERIWMFMALMLTLAAGRYLDDRLRRGGGDAAFYWTAGLLALQVLCAETFFDTLW